jgi:hypothetical protein
VADGLTGEQAVRRLLDRGGQILVFRRGYGACLEISIAHRTPEDVTVSIKERSVRAGGEPAGMLRVTGARVLRTESDRAELAREIEAARDTANSTLERVEHTFEIGQRDELQIDPGYGEIGCFAILVSVIVGEIVGLFGGWLATGKLTGPGWAIGPIVGVVIGFLTTDTVGSVIAGIPALRARQVGIAMLYSLLVPGIACAIVIVVATIQSAG